MEIQQNPKRKQQNIIDFVEILPALTSLADQNFIENRWILIDFVVFPYVLLYFFYFDTNSNDSCMEFQQKPNTTKTNENIET